VGDDADPNAALRRDGGRSLVAGLGCTLYFAV
jgi:hypothetical protein